MGVPTSEVGYTLAMPRREDHEVHKMTSGGTGKKNSHIYEKFIYPATLKMEVQVPTKYLVSSTGP
jgi:hypothetical protein